MYITKITFEATKTIQEERFEPIKMTVGIEAAISGDDEVSTSFDNIRALAYRELGRSFSARRKQLDDDAAKLEALRRKREQLDRLIANGGKGAIDEDHFYDETMPPDGQG